jgi:hypothetical protein
MAVLRVPIVRARLIYKPIKETIINQTPKPVTQTPPANTGTGTSNTATVAKPVTTTVEPTITYKFADEEIEKVIDNLISLQLSNGEADRSNSVQLTFHDPDHEYDLLLLDRALKTGGIQVPDNLLKSPNQADDRPPGDTNAPNTNAPIKLGNYTFPPDGTKGDELAASIIRYCYSIGLKDNSHIASILGNITIETVMGVYTEEIGGANTRYAPYYGRGLIQITWRDNYSRFGAYFKQDFVNNVNLVKQLRWAIPIAVGGMTGINGCPTFTGKKLSDYGSGANFDFVNARRTVNGTDKAQLVASESRKWLARIPSLVGNVSPKAVTTPNTFTPQTPATPQLTAPLPVQAPTAAKVSALPDWVVQIQIEIGWSDSEDRYVSSYWFVSRQTSNNVPSITTIGGRGIRFLISRLKRTSFDTISLRQLAERIGLDYGIDTIIPPFSSLDKSKKLQQNSETDYQFLLRVANSSGYTIQAEKESIKIVALKDAPKIKTKAEWGCIFTSSETASQERVLEALPPIESLPDDEAIGEGFSTSLEVNYPTFEVLSLQPGTLVSIEKDTIKNLPFNSAYFRTFRLKAVNIIWNGFIKVTLDLYLPVKIEPPEEEKPPGDQITQGNPKTNATGKNADILKEAQKWVNPDRDFKPGQTERCMDFVRTILRAANHPKADFITSAASDGMSTGILMASSLSGNDCGQKITNIAQLMPGDIVFFKNTYGNFPPGTITHVGIAASPSSDMIHRSTSAKPVRQVNIIQFGGFTHGIRLSES